MASLSYFTDKLSTETRVQIYEYIFGSAAHAKKLFQQTSSASGQTYKDERLMLFEPAKVISKPFDTSIFSVSKQTSAEALDTFFGSKTIRVTFDQLLYSRDAEYVPFLRKIDFVAWKQGKDQVQAAVDMALRLPRLKSVIILSDGLSWVPELKDSMTVRDWARGAGIGDVVCVDVGKYELLGRYKGIKIVNTRLRSLWSRTPNMPEGIDPSDAAQKVWKT